MALCSFLKCKSNTVNFRLKSRYVNGSINRCLLIPALTLLIFIMGCPRKTPLPIDIQAGLEIVELDTIWVYSSSHKRLVSVRLAPVEQAVDREMRCFITGGLSGTHFQLYDDGNFGRWRDSEGFADTLSGDQVPGDGVFSRRVSSGFAMNEGTYMFTFVPSDSPPPDPIEAQITIRENSPPVILTYSFPDSIHSGESGLEFSAVVLDPEGSEDIARVQMFLMSGDQASTRDTIHSFIRIDDSTWCWNSRPEIAAGLLTGDYPVSIRANDYYLSQLHEWSYGDTTVIWLENLPPRIESVTGPDTIWIPPDDTTTIFFDYEITVHDDQTPRDLDHLHLLMIRPGKTPWENDYLDDGEFPDTMAHDGVFTAGFSVNDQNETGVTYTLNWSPVDRAEQEGGVVTTLLTIMPYPPGVIAESPENRNPVYIRSNYDEPFNRRVED